MATYPGRTYKYFEGKPLWPFGFGLSLTNFSLNECHCNASLDSMVQCGCTLTNVGPISGDEVVMCFDTLSSSIRKSIGDTHPIPHKFLLDFVRVSLDAGDSTTVVFELPLSRLAIVTGDGSRRLYSGTHELQFWLGHDVPTTVAVIIEQ